MIPQRRRAASYLDRLRRLYAEMDRTYRQAADHYGFTCTGCRDNCCRTRFYHHTYLEYLYILEGWTKLPAARRSEVKSTAAAVCRKCDEADQKGRPVRRMCPLNSDGLCVLYAFRPMICRLHGIPHELRKPGRDVQYGPGCGTFTAQFAGGEYYPFDRTSFYFGMAKLEAELQQNLGLGGKIKLTIAEMVGGREQGP
ncbi:MAG: hypothetical protein JSW39_12080 [Desulfobacterales bacterium]|nr:MAG: hypothetical protein JSW39_12080 [Desulfobacterales bacterium]